MSSDPTTTRTRWLNDLTLELRLQGVPGERIGDVLAEVESHCDDAAQEPAEAFGEPAAYAASLSLAPQPAHWTSQVILPVLGLVVGFNLAVSAVLHWSEGVAITVGVLAALGVFLVFVGLLIAGLGPLLRGPAALVAWFAVGFGLMVALPLILTYELARIPSVLALVLGAVVGGLGFVAVRQIRADRVVDPRT